MEANCSLCKKLNPVWVEVEDLGDCLPDPEQFCACDITGCGLTIDGVEQHLHVLAAWNR